jgi:glycosyltransferase involved in cell wall biosynthesis
MAMAKPIVATASGGTPEIVADGVTGILVPPRDSSSLAAALMDLLKNPERRRALGAAGRERVAAHFSIQRHVRKTMDLYAEVLAGADHEPGH